MRLLHLGIIMNIKNICRLMNKYNLFCPIRKANPISEDGTGIENKQLRYKHS